jgi:hypothetical protein
MSLYAARFARVALIAASGLFLTPLPALAGLCAPVLVRLCLLPVCAPPASSRIFASSLVTASSCPPPTPPPPPLRQHPPASAALSAFALAASRSDSLSAFASSRSRGDRGSLVQLHHLRLPAGNELAQCTASGRQHSRRVHFPTTDGCRRFVPRPCGRGRGCRQFPRVLPPPIFGLPPPVFVLPPPSPSVLAILSFLRLLAVSVPDILVLVRILLGFSVSI